MMKKTVIACFILFAAQYCVGNAQEQFLQANNFYKNKEYAEALDLYSSFENKGVAVWQNMGNCAFKMNNHVDALLYWKRAERMAGAREKRDIRKNIDTAHAIIGYEEPAPSWIERCSSYVSRYSMFFLQMSFLFFWIVMFFLVWMFRRYGYLFLGLFIPVNIFLGVALFLKYQDQVYDRALVIKKDALVFSGPNEKYHKMKTLSCADECVVVEQKDSWCKIKHAGLSGWILADKIERI